jgi:hypothetical protein
VGEAVIMRNKSEDERERERERSEEKMWWQEIKRHWERERRIYIHTCVYIYWERDWEREKKKVRVRKKVRDKEWE